MNLVAGVAGNVGIAVLATTPQGALGVLVVAGQAHIAALCGRQGQLADEHAIGLVGPGLLGVLEAVAMARGAIGRTAVCGKAVGGLAHVGQVFFVMAGHAQRSTGGCRRCCASQGEHAQAKNGQ